MLILTHYPEFINQTHPIDNEKSLLHLACSLNLPQLFEFLVHNKADVMLCDGSGRLPLHYAS
jgi:hypothetical protein